MYVDSFGHSSDSIWKTLFGAIVGAGLAVVTVAAGVTKFLGNYAGDWF